ncbi:MAG TPA: tetratricopeptide repeat protein [Verrucomicrobiae bacterium]|nr:tetratricopeptide repeat protein [Verrucomicrobiae bacterium]
MSPNLDRALLLYQQSRYDLAENELRQTLATEPGNAYAHALLGLCLAHGEKFQAATSEAQQAVHLEPDFSFAHFALAHVFFDRNRFSEALSAINEAIRLEPQNADYFALLANIHLQEHRWRESLNAAEQGLEFDPEHVGCTNLRAMAMVKLGRKSEAGTTIDTALSKNPDNSLTHANQGWTWLHQGEPQKAAEHFREALRLDPQNEWARQGVIEALKARNIIYAMMLKYFLWMSKFSRRGQWGIILIGYFGYQILSSVARANPSAALWIAPLQILYIIFALMTWLAYPFFNLLLRLNKFGRLVLSREQTVATNWFGLCLLVALFGLLMCIIKGFVVPWISIALVFGFLLLPVSAVFRCYTGSARNIMTTLTILLALLGIGGVVAQFTGENPPDISTALLGFFALGTIASTWIANILIMRRPKR